MQTDRCRQRNSRYSAGAGSVRNRLREHQSGESREGSPGRSKSGLHEQGWRTFLVKVHNEGGVTAPLKAESPNAAPMYMQSRGSPDPFGKGGAEAARKPEEVVKPGEVSQRFLDIAMFDSQPLTKICLDCAWSIAWCHSIHEISGKREANLEFNVGQGTQDIGFRNAVPILFNCVPSTEVVLKAFLTKTASPRRLHY